jgi:hypothetical protein
VIIATEVERLVDVFRNRAAHPTGVFCLGGFGVLSDREQRIVSALMSTAAAELEHAVSADRVTAFIAEQPKLARLVAVK